MESREILFEKIETKKKEWEAQLKSLKSKAEGFDYDSRQMIQEQISNIDKKFKELEKRTIELRQTNEGVHEDLGDKVVRSWLELLSNIDNAMLKLKK